MECNRAKPDCQTCTEDSHQHTSNLAIPAMAAGPAAPDHLHNTFRFRLIQQLLPTFGDRAPGLWTGGHSAASCGCSSRATTGALKPHKTQGIWFLIAIMLTDPAGICTKLSSPPTSLQIAPSRFTNNAGWRRTLVMPRKSHSSQDSIVGTMPGGYGSTFSVHSIPPPYPRRLDLTPKVFQQISPG